MVYVDFDQFDDEFQRMLELLNEGQIALNDDILKIPIKSLHLKKAVAVNKGTSVRKCLDMLLARNFGCLIIVDNKKVCGIFTERDVLLKIAGQNIDLHKVKIDAYMSADPVCVNENDKLTHALTAMNKGFRHIAIVDENKSPLSVLSIRDVISYLVEFFPTDVLNLPPHPIRIGTKDSDGA